MIKAMRTAASGMSAQQMNVDNIANNLATINLILDIRDINQLSRLLTIMESLPNVMKAYRVKPG